MPTLFVDLDGVLAISWPRIVRCSVGGRLGPRTFLREELLQDVLVDGAASAVTAFHVAGWRIHVLTARGFEQAYEITKEWLDRNLIAYDALTLVDYAEEKPKVLDELAEPSDLFTDDFIAGYEEGLPKFVTQVYKACCLRCRTEPFRNNWAEIVLRYLGKQI